MRQLRCCVLASTSRAKPDELAERASDHEDPALPLGLIIGTASLGTAAEVPPLACVALDYEVFVKAHSRIPATSTQRPAARLGVVRSVR